jgi:hypothetical protein
MADRIEPWQASPWRATLRRGRDVRGGRTRRSASLHVPGRRQRVSRRLWGVVPARPASKPSHRLFPQAPRHKD